MPSRIFGCIHAASAPENPFPAHFRRKNLSRKTLGYSVFWATSDSPVAHGVYEDVHLVADAVLAGTGNLSVEEFIRKYKKAGFAQAIQDIEGQFAIALYDEKQDALYLARDHFGYKPLYYAQTSEGLAFSSLPSWLLSLDGVGRSLNYRNVALYAGAHYRFIDNDIHGSFYTDVRQLPAAHYLKFQQGRIEIRRYWDIQNHDNFFNPHDEDEIILGFRDLFLESVRKNWKSADGRSAFMLSGGMDSSSVISAVKHLTGEKQQAFSSVYSDETYDESEDIKSILDDAVSRWMPVSIDFPDIFSVTSRMIRENDAPVGTVTWLSHYLLYDTISREGYRNVFGGLGGDELNAGEFEYFFYFFRDLKHKGQEQRLSREIEKWIEYHDHPVWKKTPEVAALGWARHTNPDIPGQIIADMDKYSRYFDTVSPEFFDLPGFKPFYPHASASYLNNKTYSDIFYETSPCCIRANERHDFAYGLNTFYPFFDVKLAEYCFRIPPELKIMDGVTKHILRNAMRGILNDETRTRVKKTGWNAPFHVWILQGKNKDNLMDMLHSKRFQERGIYNHKRVMNIVSEHESIIGNHMIAENHMMFLWQLVNLELWFQSHEDA